MQQKCLTGYNKLWQNPIAMSIKRSGYNKLWQNPIAMSIKMTSINVNQHELVNTRKQQFGDLFHKL